MLNELVAYTDDIVIVDDTDTIEESLVKWVHTPRYYWVKMLNGGKTVKKWTPIQAAVYPEACCPVTGRNWEENYI